MTSAFKSSMFFFPAHIALDNEKGVTILSIAFPTGSF
jgi:hypothetical protein